MLNKVVSDSDENHFTGVTFDAELILTMKIVENDPLNYFGVVFTTKMKIGLFL